MNRSLSESKKEYFIERNKHCHRWRHARVWPVQEIAEIFDMPKI
jgi:hypothetical protein